MRHFAKFAQRKGDAVLNHYGGKRCTIINAEIDANEITSKEVNQKIRDHFAPQVAGIPGLRMKLSGQEEETTESMEGFLIAFIIVIIAVYFLLVILFNSYLQPVLIMSVIPFAMLAVFITLILHNRPLVLLSLVGMLGLIGVVINDTIVMISNLNRQCREKGKSAIVIADAATERFRPVILTTLTTFAGLLPTAYGIGGDIPSMRPMVLVMAWGLVFCTIVTLGFIPLIYSFMGVKNIESGK